MEIHEIAQGVTRNAWEVMEIHGIALKLQDMFVNQRKPPHAQLAHAKWCCAFCCLEVEGNTRNYFEMHGNAWKNNMGVQGNAWNCIEM